MAKNKKGRSVLVTCLQKKNMWAKKFEKIWGIGTFRYVRSKSGIFRAFLAFSGHFWHAMFWPLLVIFPLKKGTFLVLKKSRPCRVEIFPKFFHF